MDLAWSVRKSWREDKISHGRPDRAENRSLRGRRQLRGLPRRSFARGHFLNDWVRCRWRWSSPVAPSILVFLAALPGAALEMLGDSMRGAYSVRIAWPRSNCVSDGNRRGSQPLRPELLDVVCALAAREGSVGSGVKAAWNSVAARFGSLIHPGRCAFAEHVIVAESQGEISESRSVPLHPPLCGRRGRLERARFRQSLYAAGSRRGGAAQESDDAGATAAYLESKN